MIDAAVRPSGPYSLRLSARLAGDPTHRARAGVLTAALPGGGVAAARQRPDGVVEIRAESETELEHMRWMLALDDDHSEFLALVADDPLLGRAVCVLKGLRPLRLATVAHSLLRGLAGQLVTWQQAKEIERSVIRRVSGRGVGGLYEPPSSEALGRLSAAELRSLGLHARRAATLIRLCRDDDLERLRDLPTPDVAARLERERGLGPWTAGVVCVRGLGRFEHGLVGDLGLIKLCTALLGRPAGAADTAELLRPYGEWAGLASVYFLAALGRGLVPVRAKAA